MASLKEIVTDLEGREYIVAEAKSGETREPNISSEQTFSDGSVWFVVEQV